MNRVETIITVPEYGSGKFIASDKTQELSYLQEDCFRSKDILPYKVRELLQGTVEIENTSYAGIIELDSVRIHFSTKVKTNLFYMLSFLKDDNNLRYDPSRIIDIEEGNNFFDILGRLFVNELQAISRRGFCKKYVRREENVSFLKGRMLIRRQIRNQIRKVPKLFCSYDDLTHDNLENRIVLRAATLLTALIRFNDVVRRDLIRYSNMMKEEVTLDNVMPEDCDKVQYSRLNDYYEPIIQFSKVILQDYFIRSVHKGRSRGFNFIVNMNQVYEDFITEMISEVVEEDQRFDGYVVESQEKFDSLVKEKKVITKPDILLRRRNTKEYASIIDAKYKRQENNADYYQVIAYALAIPKAESCCLVYPAGEKIEDTVLTVDTSPFQKPGREIKIHAIKINLFWDQASDFKSYIRKIKEELKVGLLNAIG